MAVTVIQPNCGALLAKLVTRLSGQGGVVTVIDGDRETLAVVDLGMHKRPEGVTLRLVQEDLAALCAGRSEHHHEAQDVIVVDGLVDHLPDRMVASFAGWCSSHLHPEGRIVAIRQGNLARTRLPIWKMMNRRVGPHWPLPPTTALTSAF